VTLHITQNSHQKEENEEGALRSSALTGFVGFIPF